MFTSRTLFLLVSTALTPVIACDLCCLSTIDGNNHGTGWAASVGLRISQLDHIEADGVTIDNPENQYLTSANIQATLAYQLDEHWSLQAILPYLHRSYRRVEGGEVESGKETGFGDAVLAVSGNIMLGAGKDRSIFIATAGLKLPSGNSARLAEEENEVPAPPGSADSAVHGHDLALGSGSWDGVFAIGARTMHGHWFASADLQYTLRTEGDHHFRYGNDFIWSAGPGYQVLPGEEISTGIQALISGETKAEDTANGERSTDTALTAWYIGAVVTLTSENMTGDIGVDLPIAIDNSGVQAVPTWRARVSMAYFW